MNEQTDNKADVRAWLFELLAELERCKDCYGEKSETAGRKITIIIQFQD
jgi:hypothetical protein